VRESYASRLIGFHPEKARFRALAGIGRAIRDSSGGIDTGNPVGAVSAGVALHDAAHMFVSVFLDVE